VGQAQAGIGKGWMKGKNSVGGCLSYLFAPFLVKKDLGSIFPSLGFKLFGGFGLLSFIFKV